MTAVVAAWAVSGAAPNEEDVRDGVVAQVMVAAGDRVAVGQPLVCVEAMKMEMWLNAATAGTVRVVHVKAKDSVASGTLLVELETAE